MENAQTLKAVIQQLRNIFLDKHELKGYDDWDSFFGCINAIESVAQDLESAEEQVESTEENTVEE